MGKLRLEGEILIFRGDFRLTIPRSEMKLVEASDGVLIVRIAESEARFELGGPAQRWKDKILNPPSLFDKLGVKPGSRVSLTGNFDETFEAELGARADVGRRPRKESDIVLMSVETRADLDGIPRAAAYLAPAGGLWIVYRKGQKTITEMDVLNAGRAAGLTDHKVVAFSKSQTALRFVTPVGKRRSR
jgi:hypothetical protein